jgi:hypothetical protein
MSSGWYWRRQRLTLALDEGEEVRIDHLRVSGAHAMRVALIDLQSTVLHEFR